MTYWRQSFAEASFLLILSVLATPARAIDIVLNFDAAGSTVPDFDPNLSQLPLIFAGVEQYWEDIFEDPGVVSITYRYKTLPANPSNPSEIPLANGQADTISGGKPTSGHININSSDQLTWYFDPTPLVLDGYVMQTKLYQAWNNDDDFSGAPPPVLEVTHIGGGGPNSWDMFTVALHEVGHVLGLSHDQMAKAETVGEGDFDFDVPSALVGGATMAIKAAGNDPTDVQHWSHVAPGSLMCYGCGNKSLRYLPTATDVFAIASAAGWNQIDLKRKYFLSGGDWHTAGNWIGNRVPDAADDVFLENEESPITAGLSADAVANNLLLGDGARLSTNNHVLDVSGEITIQGSEPVQTRLRLTGGGRIEAETVYLGLGGELTVEWGALWVNEIEIGGPEGQVVMLPGSSTLRVNRLTGFSDVMRFFGNLEIGLPGPATGLLEIGAGQSLQVLGTTTVGAADSGTVRAVLGGAADTGDLHVGSLGADGIVEVDGYVPALGVPARWDVDGTLWIGSSGTGSGTMVVEQGGVATVSNSATVLGSATSPGRLTVQTNGSLTIENSLNVNAHGTVELLGGQIAARSLSVTSGGAWTHHDGVLEVDGGSFSPPASPSVADSYVIDGFEAADLPQIKLSNGASTFLAPNNLYVGRYQRGKLQIDGGSVAHFTGDAYLGWGLGQSVEGSVDVNGSGSWLIVDGDLEVGDGRVGRLTVTDGGGVDSSLVGSLGRDVIGQDAGTADGTAMVTGIGSTWKTDDLVVGDKAIGRLTVADGAAVQTVGNASIAAFSGSAGSFARLDGGSTSWHVSGDLVVGGTGSTAGDHGSLTVDDGQLNVDGTLRMLGGTETFLRAGTVSTHELDLSDGVLEWTGGLLQADVVQGALHNQGGILAPGNSPGLTTIHGDYFQEQAGVMQIEIGGPGVTEFDSVRIESSGMAVVSDSTLDVALVDLGGGSYVPQVGDSFTVLTAEGGIDGEFSTGVENLPPLPAGRRWEMLYFSESLTLSVLAFLQGDFNDDGGVDAADLDLLAANVGSSNPLFDLNGDGAVTFAFNTSGVSSDSDYLLRAILQTEYGDANLDGRVDLLDLDVLGQGYGDIAAGWSFGNFDGSSGTSLSDLDILGQTYGYSGGGGLISSSVPEPVASVTLILGWACSILLGRRRAS